MSIKDSFSMAKRMEQVFLSLQMATFMMGSGLTVSRMVEECTWMQQLRLFTVVSGGMVKKKAKDFSNCLKRSITMVRS
jgi:hypothetical protein